MDTIEPLTCAPYTLPQLRVFLQKYFCGCGQPESAVERLRDLLRWHHRENGGYKGREAAVNDAGFEMLLLYFLDHMGLTEHGGSVGGAWLTAEGEGVLGALERLGEDVEPATQSCCIHGYAMGLDGGDAEECVECQ